MPCRVQVKGVWCGISVARPRRHTESPSRLLPVRLSFFPKKHLHPRHNKSLGVSRRPFCSCCCSFHRLAAPEPPVSSLDRFSFSSSLFSPLPIPFLSYSNQENDNICSKPKPELEHMSLAKGRRGWVCPFPTHPKEMHSARQQLKTAWMPGSKSLGARSGRDSRPSPMIKYKI